jgi:glyoxylase-like metal-dependent hydrolase (beta-lactamase superfamily II)
VSVGATGVVEVADGVLVLTRAAVNCYLVDTVDGPVLIDTGLPRTWPVLRRALAAVGLVPDDLATVYLTHGHFDHVGMADRLQREHRVPVHVHEDDRRLARHPYRYAHEASRLRYPLAYPRAIPTLARMAAAGALGVRGVDARGDVRPGRRLHGGIVPVATPGHTLGHCAFHLPDRGVLFTGDALVTFDPYTGSTGPRAVARAATADSAAALDAVRALLPFRADVLLPGHGDAYRGPVAEAVRLALEHGVA